MALRFKVACAECGIVVVQRSDLLVMFFRNPATQPRYTFMCQSCGEARSGALNAALSSALVAEGVKAVNNFEYETGSRAKSPISGNELGWFVQALDENDDLAECVKRWEVSDGKNWTAREADRTEGAGRDGEAQ